MKKTLRILMLLAIVAIVLIVSGSVYAATTQNFKDWNVADVQEAEGVYTIKLTHDLTDGDPKLSQDLEIMQGEKVILDLNGYTLQGYTTGFETIYVHEGAELTIVDNSEAKTGKVIPASGAGTVQLPVIRNDGTLTIEDGTFEQKDAYGVVINYGTLNINGGKFVQSADAKWSILDNKGTTTISGGDFDGDAAFWMVRNEASLTVTGGDFDSTGNANMIGSIYQGDSLPAENNVKTEIKKGTFDSEGGIFVVYEGTKLEISGGEVTSVQSNAVYNAGETTITGGTIKSENSAAIVLVNNEGATEAAKISVSGATVTSAEGRDAVEVINNVKDQNFGTATDENGNIIAGKVEIAVDVTEVKVGEAISATVTVSGVEVSTGYTVLTSNDSVVKVNADNTIQAVGEGNAELTIKVGDVEKVINVAVLGNSEENPPEDPTEDPTQDPTEDPTQDPTEDPTEDPTQDPTEDPTEDPTQDPTEDPTEDPTKDPTQDPSKTEESSDEDSDIVQTGDYIYVAVTVLAIVVIANVVYAVIRKKNAK